jgi:2'-5' RNA ligase
VEDFFATIADRWPAGREDYHWHVLPGSDLLRDRICRPYCEIIHQAGLVPVRSTYLHITIQHLAPVGEVTHREIGQIIGLVRDRCSEFAAFAVTVGRAQAWDYGIVCPIRPGNVLASLWQLASNATTEVTGGRFEVSPAVFHPHMSLAYATGHVDQAAVRAQLADRDAPEIELQVTRLALVAQRYDCREITFRLLDEIPLAG